MITQNLLILAAKLEFIKMSTTLKNAHGISWFIDTKSDIQSQQSFRLKYGGESPARFIPPP